MPLQWPSRDRIAVAAAISLALVACGRGAPASASASATETAAAARPSPVLKLVDAFIARPPRDRKSVERITGATLTKRPHPYWAMLAATDVAVGEARVDIDLRLAGPQATGEEPPSWR